MAEPIFDGNINHIADAITAEDGVKAKKFLAKLDPIDEMQKQDGERFKAAVKKIIENERDPQTVEDGKRLFAALKRLFGIDEVIDETVMEEPALPTPGAVVDTSVLTGPREGLKTFLIDKQRGKIQE